MRTREVLHITNGSRKVSRHWYVKVLFRCKYKCASQCPLLYYRTSKNLNLNYQFLVGLITVSVGFGIALAILILTCAFTQNWVALSSRSWKFCFSAISCLRMHILILIPKLVVVYVLIPAPMVLVGIKGQDGEMNLWVQFGYCLGGFVLSCLFGKDNHVLLQMHFLCSVWAFFTM